MENNLKIEASCGLKPVEVENIIIGNNPDFVFLNDPNFSTTVLYDIEGNIINVNSWIECAHYVNGGWSSVVQTSFVGTIVLLQLTAVLYLGYGFFKYFNQRRLYD